VGIFNIFLFYAGNWAHTSDKLYEKGGENVPKVFIPSLPTRYDAVTQTRVPSLDLNPASQYGELVNMIEGPTTHDHLASGITQIRTVSVMPDDLIMAVGDLVLAAAAIAHACRENGSAKILRWDKLRHGYDIVEVSI